MIYHYSYLVRTDSIIVVMHMYWYLHTENNHHAAPQDHMTINIMVAGALSLFSVATEAACVINNVISACENHQHHAVPFHKFNIYYLDARESSHFLPLYFNFYIVVHKQ